MFVYFFIQSYASSFVKHDLTSAFGSLYFKPSLVMKEVLV